MKIPKAIGACADLLWKLRQDRLAIQKKVEAMEKDEVALREHIIRTLPKSEASGVSGRLANVRIVSDEVPTVKNWEAFYAYVRKTGSFDLLQRRLAKEAVNERLEDRVKLPGVEVIKIPKVSLTKA